MIKASSPFWGLAFRPFFFFGTLFAAIAVLLWAAMVSGFAISLAPGVSDPVAWHGHEMVYGFALGIIAGFLLSAVKNWTNQPGLSGRKLQALFAVWLAGRLLPFIPGVNAWVIAIADLSFYPALVAALWPYLTKEGQAKNRVFLVFIGALFLGDLLTHLDFLHLGLPLGRRGLWFGVDVILVTIMEMAGRTVPMFIERGIPGAKPIRKYPRLERLAVPSMGLFATADLIFGNHPVTAAIAFIAGGMFFVRWLGWHPLQGLKTRLLAIVIIAYFWFWMGLFMRGLAAFDIVPVSAAIHALTVGTIGTIIYAITSRMSLGFTGRPITITNWIVVGYALIALSAAFRVLPPVFWPQLYMTGIHVSATLWAIAFLIFAGQYGPWFMRSRIDGKSA